MTLPIVRPGGDIQLRINGWPKVNQALQAIDAVEASGVDPADAAPDHWRHVHNRLTASEQRDTTLAITLLGVSALALLQLEGRPPWLVWNASASVPIGLYAVATIIDAHDGDLVVVRPNGSYLPRGVPLLKYVAALANRSVASAAAPPSTRSKWDDAREGDQPQPRASCLSGLPCHRPWRGFPDGLVVRRLARRTVFRATARRHASPVARSLSGSISPKRRK